MQPPQAYPQQEAAVEQYIKSLLQQRPQPLYRMVAAHFEGTTVRAHGAACLAAAHAAGGSEQAALPAAGAVELAAQYAQVHAGIYGGGSVLKSPIISTWGPSQAINAGDGMHALARLSVCNLADAGVSPASVLECIATLDRAFLEVAEAQHDALTLAGEPVDAQAAQRIAESTGGAFLGCALELGALVAGAAPGCRAAFRQAGRMLGMALALKQMGIAADMYAREATELLNASGLPQTSLAGLNGVLHLLLARGVMLVPQVSAASL